LVKTGNSLNDDHELPDWMNTQEMRQAMGTLRQFSEKDKKLLCLSSTAELPSSANVCVW
jgi:hypothetical protein